MRKTLFVSILSVFVMASFISCNSHSSNANLPSAGVAHSDSAGGINNNKDVAVISFETDFHDFGKLREGEKVTYAFKFKNTGNFFLIISNVSTSCGCTVSSFPKKPVLPGEESTIDVSFDSTGKHGLQTKMITIFGNTEPSTTTLRIRAQVIEPEDS